MKKSNLAMLIGGLLSSSISYAAAPGAPTIDWGEYTYALVELNRDASSYEEIVVGVHDSVAVTVSWQTWSGDPAETANVKLDGDTVWTGNGSVKSATFDVSKGGVYDMTVELCNADGCSESGSVELTIAGTSGARWLPSVSAIVSSTLPLSLQPSALHSSTVMS